MTLSGVIDPLAKALAAEIRPSELSGWGGTVVSDLRTPPAKAETDRKRLEGRPEAARQLYASRDAQMGLEDFELATSRMLAGRCTYRRNRFRV